MHGRCLCLLLMVLIGTPARADTPPLDSIPVVPLQNKTETGESDDSTELPPLVVVGTRTPREIQDLAGSVSVIDAREIEYRQASSLGELLSDLPGVAIEGGPRANAEFVNVRGLSGPRVLLIVDGARQNFLGGHRSSLLVEPELLKQVELLRGPASALWGSDAIGGVVVLSTKDANDILEPGERWGGRLRSSFASNDGETLYAGIGAARLGEFDGVVSLTQRAADNYRRGDGIEEPHTASDTASGLAKLSWFPAGSPHHLGLSHQRFLGDSVSPSNPATTVTETNPLIDRRNDARYSVLRYDYDGASGGLLQAAQFNLYRDALHLREDRVDEPRFDRTDFDTDGANGHLSLPLSLGAGEDTLLTLGSDGFRDRARSTRDGAPRPQFPDADRSLIGAFVQAELPLGPVTLVPGLRHDRYRAQSNQDDSPGVRESATSAKLGAVYRVNDELRLRASFNEAFRAPGLIEIYAAGQHFLGNNFVPNPGLRPEKARNLELGFHLDRPGLLNDHRASLIGSVYRNQVRDFIELFVEVESEFPAPRCLSPMPPVGCVNRNDDGTLNPASVPVFVGGITSSRNLERTTLEGFELEGGYAVGPLRLGLSYSRVRGKEAATGEPLFNLAADQLRSTVDFQPGAGLWRGWRATLGHNQVFAQDRVPSFIDENGERQNVVRPTPAYQLWDLSLSWEPLGRSGRAFGVVAPRLTLGVDNLTDRAYRDHLNVLQSPGRNLRGGLSFGF